MVSRGIVSEIVLQDVLGLLLGDIQLVVFLYQKLSAILASRLNTVRTFQSSPNEVLVDRHSIEPMVPYPQGIAIGLGDKSPFGNLRDSIFILAVHTRGKSSSLRAHSDYVPVGRSISASSPPSCIRSMV